MDWFKNYQFHDVYIKYLFQYFLNKLLGQVMENIVHDENEGDFVEISSQIFSESKEARIDQDDRIFQSNKQNEDSESFSHESSDKISKEF